MEAMAMVSFSSQLLATVVTLLSLCLMAASAGSAVLTLCVNGGNNTNTPFHDVDGTVISEAVQATSASDRSSSVMCHSIRRITTTTGPDREMDYALAQCRPDVPAGECSSCLGACLDTIGYMCDSAAVRYDVCLLRFGKQDFSIFDVNEYTVSVFDGRSQPGLPKDVTTGLLSRVAANATASGSRTAAGIADYPTAAATEGRASVYGLAQCITQMSAPDCGRCLRDAWFRLSEDFNSSAGMQVLRPSCMVRYATSLFFNTSLLPVTHVSVPDDAGAAAPAGSASVRAAKGRRFQDFKFRPKFREMDEIPSASVSGGIGFVQLIAISAGLGGGAAALAIAALVALWCRRRSRKSKSATGVGNYSYQTLVDATGNFSEENQLGSGGCGVVYKGILENKQEIAVKKLVEKELKELEREVSLVAQLQHENLVKFLGHCFQEGEMFLVYEYLMNKSISNYFKGSVDRQKLDWPKWLNIIKGVARGLTYLHRESGKDIVHRDLKPSNVLLDSNFAPKIADFDLARGYNRERSHEVTHNRAGTFGYIAPECYAEGKFSTKSDVYSYGVMVLEIIVGQSISRFDNENCVGLVEHVWLHWSDCRVGDMLDRDHLGLVNHEQMQQASQCVQVALLCVQKDRSARPAMDEVIHLLNGEMRLRDPSVPGYIAAPAGSRPSRHSVNGVTISVLEPRS